MEALFEWFTPTRWAIAIGLGVASIWHQLTKSSQSKTRVKRSFLFINFLNASLLEIGVAKTQESSSVKSLPALNIQENIENNEEPSLKGKETSAGGKKELKDDIASLKKAANDGDAEARFKLALKYSKGKGVEKNLEKAFELYKKSAQQEHSRAQNNLGNMYSRGEYVKQDHKQAVRWYRKAADQGNPTAQFNLGLGRYYGEGVLESYKKAADWYRQAAEQGHAGALNNLSAMYSRGQSVERNFSMAYGLFLLAAQGGEEVAKDNLLKLKSELTTEQITEGQKIAQEWQARIDANPNKEE